MLTVYQHPYSQHSRRVLALLEIANANYRSEFVDLEAGQHMSPEYLAMNPNHQVPTIVDGEFVLSESNAILRYLCGKHSLETWYPTDPAVRACIDQWLDWNQSRLARPVIDVVFNKVFLGDNGDKDAIARGQAALVELVEVLAAGLADKTYLAGDTPTIADLSVASNITQLSLADDVPDHETIRDWYARICEIDGFHKTLPPTIAGAA